MNNFITLCNIQHTSGNQPLKGPRLGSSDKYTTLLLLALLIKPVFHLQMSLPEATFWWILILILAKCLSVRLRNKWFWVWDLNFRFRACFEQGVLWHSGNYRMWIHSEMHTWHDRNIQSNFFWSKKSRILVFVVFEWKKLLHMKKFTSGKPALRSSMSPRIL